MLNYTNNTNESYDKNMHKFLNVLLFFMLTDIRIRRK